MSAGLNALNATPHQILQSAIMPTPGSIPRNDLHAPVYTTLPVMTNPICQLALPIHTINQALHMSSETRATPMPTTGSHCLSSPSTTLEQIVAKRFAEMEAMIQRIPRVPTPLKKSLPHSYVDSPFVDSMVEMPKKFAFPNMKMYNGTIDPMDHIASYKKRMFTAAIPCEQCETCMCKSFSSNLQGPALQWYMNLPNNSISLFTQLTNTFVEQFASSKILEKLSSDLYRIQQWHTESLRDYVRCFNREKVSIPLCN